MKTLLLFLTLISGITLYAQEGFASADEALFFLDEHFTATTQEKKGSIWIDPVLLQFEYEDAIYVHTYTGKITEKDYLEGNEEALKKLKVKEGKFTSIVWQDITSITLTQKGSEWWLAINGPYKDMDDKSAGSSCTFYIADATQAEKIKAALNHLRQ
ncbi:MAG: hypothetical protein V4581_13060 [Bacteroidota bacterium]